jgi:hypothetical protein
MSKVTYNELTYDFDEIRNQMDKSLTESLQDTTKTDQDFLNSYLVFHHEKYGEQFVVK